MPRARNIKPSLFKNEILGEADPLLTLLFQGLWCLADREGRLEDRPKRIKAEIFPYRETPDINGYLTELAQLGFIDRYEVGGVAIIQVLNFTKHQSPHKTEKASELPEKPNKTDGCPLTGKPPLNNESTTGKESLIPDSSNTDSSNTELIPPKKKAKRKTKLPDDFLLTPDRKNLACDYWQGKNRSDLMIRVGEIFDQFTTHAQANGKTYLDWDAAWRTWYTNAVKFERQQNGTGSNYTPALNASERREQARIEWEREHCT